MGPAGDSALLGRLRIENDIKEAPDSSSLLKDEKSLAPASANAPRLRAIQQVRSIQGASGQC